MYRCRDFKNSSKKRNAGSILSSDSSKGVSSCGEASIAQLLPNLLNNLCCLEKPLSSSEFDAFAG